MLVHCIFQFSVDALIPHVQCDWFSRRDGLVKDGWLFQISNTAGAFRGTDGGR